MKTTADQLSLPLFDTTALTSSMGLYSGLSFGEPADDLIARPRKTPPRRSSFLRGTSVSRALAASPPTGRRARRTTSPPSD